MHYYYYFDVLLLFCCLHASIKSNLSVPPSCESEPDIVKLNQLPDGFWSDEASMELFRKILHSFDYQTDLNTYTPLTKLLARQARPGTTHDGSGIEAKTYSSISATNQHQLRQKIYQSNLQSFFS